MRIYVASSWRNSRQPEVVKELGDAGHEVYDFKNPPNDAGVGLGFHWSDIGDGWQSWDSATYVQALQHPVAIAGFESDWNAMEWADACVLVLPSGRSSHLEAGYFVGAKKTLVILLDDDNPIEPELMNKMCDFITSEIEQVVDFLPV